MLMFRDWLRLNTTDRELYTRRKRELAALDWKYTVWRAYIFVYAVGERIVEAWTAGEPAGYRRLLTEQLTTTDLR